MSQGRRRAFIHVARPGGTIGYVGVPHGPAEGGFDVFGMFFSNLTLRGGPAPVRAYMHELMDDVLEGTLDPSPVFDMTIGLDGVRTATPRWTSDGRSRSWSGCEMRQTDECEGG